jgi:hypothetical protein
MRPASKVAVGKIAVSIGRSVPMTTVGKDKAVGIASF